MRLDNAEYCRQAKATTGKFGGKKRFEYPFKTNGGSIAENINLLKHGTLQEYLPGHTCGGHGHSHGCSH
jgi:hypothetical protein